MPKIHQNIDFDQHFFDEKSRKRLPKEKQSSEGETGRVIAIQGETVQVMKGATLFLCVLKGALKQKQHTQKNLVVIGDRVQFIPTKRGPCPITHINKRTSFLSRSENIYKRKEHLIAANIDQAFITNSVVTPTLKPSLMDRYIIAAQKGNMRPILIINKCDLLTSTQFPLQERSKEKALLQMCLETYQRLDIPIFAVSAETEDNLFALSKMMRGKTSVFVGQSGVGKSSLINRITHSKQRIGSITAKTKKGSHTTTNAQLIPLPEKGFCVDTPGVKSFGLWNVDKPDIKTYFAEFAPFKQQCRYRGCCHLHEPDCAVKQAVENGAISPLRYESYCILMAEDVLQKWR